MEGTSYGWWLTAAVSMAYIGVAIDMGLSDKWALAVVFTCYSIANVGFLWMMK
jgi:hypothetical protein